MNRSIFIEGRRWFDKTYGNSYYSARIHLDGDVIKALPFQYGYENAYQYEAMRQLADDGIIPSEYANRSLHSLKELGFATYAVIYDAKQSDVKRFGIIGN